MQHQYCSQCGRPIDPRANFCAHCGARLHVQHHVPEQAVQQSQQPVSSRPQPQPMRPAVSSPPISQQGQPSASQMPTMLAETDIVPRRHLAPRAKILFFMNYIGVTAILLPFMAAFAFFDLLFAIVLTVSYFALCYIAAMITYNNFYFSIDQNGFEKDHGVFFKKHVSIPFDQIQNVNTKRTIIDRTIGVARLEIETAGSANPKKREIAGGMRSHSEGYLPGISATDARRFHDILLRKANDD